MIIAYEQSAMSCFWSTGQSDSCSVPVTSWTKLTSQPWLVVPARPHSTMPPLCLHDSWCQSSLLSIFIPTHVCMLLLLLPCFYVMRLVSLF